MKKNIIIVMLAIMVIGLSGYIAYDKLLNQKEISENQEKENNNENEENNYETNNEQEDNITWYDYLLEQEFVSASLQVCTIDDKYVYGKESDWQPNPGTGRDITKDELKRILTTIKESEGINTLIGEVVKGYGYAAPACVDELNYRYIHKGKEYSFKLADETTIITEDQDFIKVLNNHMKEYTNYALNKNNTNYDNLVKEMMKDYIRY